VISPLNFEEKTGFNSIRQKLTGYCSGEGGKKYVAEMGLSIDFDTISKNIEITEDFSTMLLTVFGYPSSEYFDT